jgi:hypothetical protein
MQVLAILLLLYLFLVVVVFPIWAITSLQDLRSLTRSLRTRLGELEAEILNLRAALNRRAAEPVAAKPEPPLSVAPAPAAVVPPLPVVIVPPAPVPEEIPAEEIAPVFALEPALANLSAAAPVVPPPATEPLPPVLPPAPDPAPVVRPVYVPPPPRPRWTDNINWEQFMGAKLFAWLGGLALFLGVAFFVKYSFDHDLIPPAVRVALGFVFGAGLVVGGLRLDRRRYRITAQTLIAAGIVSLYAVTFTCGRNFYNFLDVTPMFLLMALITTAAFVLAVRLEAQVVAILGMLGGFLTPVLLSTGVDNPGGLFGYLALLDAGLVAVALHRRWFHLVPLGAGGTVLMMVGWVGKFYAPEKTGTAMMVCLGFCALYLAAREAARRLGREHPLLGQTAAALPAVGFCFAWFFAGHGAAAAGPGLLFGYVFLCGLAALVLAWREGRGELVAVGAAATTLLMIRWTAVSFRPGDAGVVMTVGLAFSAVYFAVYLLARRLGQASSAVLGSAVALPAVSLALFLLQQSGVGAQPGPVFGFILLTNLLLLALAWLDDRLPRLHLFAGLAVFGLLAVWTGQSLTPGLLPWALAAILLFAVLHAVFPLVLERHRPAAAPTWWSQLFPPLALLLMLFPLFKLETVPLVLWPAILLVDVLAIALAALSASALSVAVVLVLTLVATGASLFHVPVATGLPFSLLLVIGFFALFFFGAAAWLVRRLGARLPAGGATLGGVRAQLPAFASLLPFLLLLMACGRFPIPDPSALFGLGLLLVVLTLGVAVILAVEWLPACALAGMAALEWTWHAQHFHPREAALPLAWYAGFYALFAAFPFLFRRRFAAQTGPWCVAALSGLVHFGLVYRALPAAWPALRELPGLVPILFVFAPLVSLVAVPPAGAAGGRARLNQLAWFGGVALFFITLIFPLQFERQWLTVAWALEGVGLLWLFHRVPHPGLRATGAVLLVTAFVRLALNPAVLGYHARSGAILNWYLYAYGLAIAALFAGARLLAPPRERALGLNLPPLLGTLGTILAFLLLNLEIADFFTPAGAPALTFQFSGNFARDMSYTIGWALFALGLLAAGLWRHRPAVRYAAIALLSVALLKLFFHDLARLEALYRIGALFAVAVIAIVASFAYQRFLPAHESPPPPAS